ncbi:DUF4189 domain-containing protein [Xanthomonas albilineans]|uniref:DUF4189 domain-containing protein n=2 Tax=Xanthomonas albilineans TaxID=29447 RepID=UPI0009BC02C1|nr:DUF4189 domain-containing protein [Xanthomonas albilineans]PPU93634.1 DUF4189 domain-containing protein [Xanthomonas albilineans]
MKYVSFMAFSIFIFSFNASAEGGCPPGQLPAQSNGSMSSCVPIPQDSPEPQQPRPTGKWLKTWGAIAGDDGDDFGVSTGKLNKISAENEALENCQRGIEKKCHIIQSYENQCAAVAEPNKKGAITRSITSGPSLEETSDRAKEDCQKKNPGSQCTIGYSNCTKQIFQRF